MFGVTVWSCGGVGAGSMGAVVIYRYPPVGPVYLMT